MIIENKSTAIAARAEKAYAFYLSLGDRRNYAQVAKEMGVSLPTIKRWSKAGGWTSRVRESEAEAARAVIDRFQSDQTAHTERNLKMVRAALMVIARGIADGKIKVQLSDFPRLAQFEEEQLARLKPEQDKPWGRVIVYIPDNGRGPKGAKIPTVAELRAQGLDPYGDRRDESSQEFARIDTR